MFVREEILNNRMLDDILETELRNITGNIEIVFTKDNEEYFLAYGCGVEENFYTMACFNKKIKDKISEKAFDTKLLEYVLHNQKYTFLDESMDISGLRFYCLDKPLEPSECIYDSSYKWYYVDNATIKDNKLYVNLIID